MTHAAARAVSWLAKIRQLVISWLCIKATLSHFVFGDSKWKKGGFSTGHEISQTPVPCAMLSFNVFFYFAVVHQGVNNFRTVLLLNQTLKSTSDPRQDGQSSSFTVTSSSQKGNGTRNCRASLVAEGEKPPARVT